MKTNRLMTRQRARELDLSSRVMLEARITDAAAEARQAAPVQVPADWKFDDYRNRSPWRRHLFGFFGPLEGRTILDLGCGAHPTPIYFALAGARRVVACDVSPKAASLVRELARQHGVADRVTATVCPAEHMPLDDGQFDLVHGEAVLHHLQLPQAGREIARVLKPGGRAAFKDPLGQNRLLEFVRDYLPYKRKHAAKATDAPLRFRDIETFGKAFTRCSYHGFGFSSVPAGFLSGRRRTKLVRAAYRLDGLILRSFPRLHRFCQYVVTCVEK